jgi:hypothetical protein
MKFAIFSKDCGDQAINLENYLIHEKHEKHESIQSDINLFRVFHAFRGQ